MKGPWILAVWLAVLSGGSLWGESPSPEKVRQALRRAVEFYDTRVSTQGGYHFHYTEDLSYGRSESAEGPTRVEVQRQGTPLVGMAYLTAYQTTADRYYLEAARRTAMALVKGQLCSGGWDYSIEFDPAKRPNYAYRADGGCRPSGPETPDGQLHNTSTLDDNVTQAALRLLMRVDRELGFQDERIHEAALYGLQQLERVQYPNGAWPQRFQAPPDPSQFPARKASYPDSWPREWPGSGYRVHYTLNDNAVLDVIDLFLEAARIYKNPGYQAAAERGGDFLLSAQMPEPQPGWAQQYDRDMHPAWARIFEPPSITGGEAQGVLKVLLLLYRETGRRKYLEPVPRALDYYRRSALPATPNPSEIRRRACPPGTKLCMARFYELKTNRPLYITKGTRVSVSGHSSTLVDGYALSYSDESVITHYGVLVRGDDFENVAREYERVLRTEPALLKRPERLSGLSPWSGDAEPVGAADSPGWAARPAPSAARVASILESLDERGAWVEEGRIGREDRVVSVFAGEPMLLTVGERVIEVSENDTVEMFRGRRVPPQRIISSSTFADNLELLCSYLRAAAP